MRWKLLPSQPTPAIKSERYICLNVQRARLSPKLSTSYNLLCYYFMQGSTQCSLCQRTSPEHWRLARQRRPQLQELMTQYQLTRAIRPLQRGYPQAGRLRC